jgi:hypothetical protein
MKLLKKKNFYSQQITKQLIKNAINHPLQSDYEFELNCLVSSFLKLKQNGEITFPRIEKETSQDQLREILIKELMNALKLGYARFNKKMANISIGGRSNTKRMKIIQEIKQLNMINKNFKELVEYFSTQGYSRSTIYRAIKDIRNHNY